MGGKKKKRRNRKRSSSDATPRHELVHVQHEPPEDLEAYWEQLDAFFDELPARIEELRTELVTSMEPFDAYDVVVNLLLAQLPFRPDEYRESTHDGLIAYVEYVAMLLLERPSRAGSQTRTNPVGAPEFETWMPL